MKGLWIFIIPIIGVLGSCTQGGSVVDQTAVQFTKDTTTVALYLAQNRIDATKLPVGIWFIVDSAANGIRATFNDSIKLKYTARLLSDNSVVEQVTIPKHFVLDSLSFAIQTGLQQFQSGSKGRLFMPSYYSGGGSNVIFEFKLTDVKDHQLKLDTIAIDSYLNQHGINAVKDASGLRFTVDTLRVGTNPYLVDDIQVNYTAKNLSDGSIVDQGTSISFNLSGLILGWQIGLQKMPQGSTFTFYLPSSLAYGPKGSGKTIKANANLIFSVKLLKVIHH